MTIAYGVELILELAVAMGATRFWYDHLSKTNGIKIARDLVIDDGFGFTIFLAALGVAGVVGLTIEMARRRSPERWDEGRWVWSLAGLFPVLACLEAVAIS